MLKLDTTPSGTIQKHCKYQTVLDAEERQQVRDLRAAGLSFNAIWGILRDNDKPLSESQLTAHFRGRCICTKGEPA